ncbi:beta-1,3-galactosyl-O-glycosyl-glycoprotein beta-1,6-N-acetylglucosaminyltransferase 4-like [Chanos chanos]|uniref:Beta-1,3-galactosyl-O-glycosyl-glycoprotein beta-1,6-N-acetylglucosaminyltransferase 4-like n=1 Tax=Chanos chanos TaxID=29144 RepID=A0A6J2V2S7_CHACN|nr:beta-1,3-galactosyl-O-glycosyl-glycoprotein beta-1,6-N-acetylglucosaminyltransferase 4-like [Chanos chanos]
MRRCLRQNKMKRALLLIFLSSLLMFSLFICFSKVDDNGTTREIERFQLTKEHSINCSAIYDMDPVEIGKTLTLRRKNTLVQNDDSVVNATSDCGWYVESRGFSNIPTSKAEKEFPLAYSLVVHKDAAMVERLLRSIYVPQNLYCIHYDQKSSAQFISAMQGLSRCLPNILIASKLERVQYASITRLKADLNCLSDLLKSDVKWMYVINLCGQDFPLRSNSELVADLKSLNGANMLESTRPSEMKKKRFQFQYVLKDYNFEYQKLPVKTSKKKDLPPHNIEVFVGSAYFVLSREFVGFVQTSPLVKDFLAWSEDTYSPDEHFWATLIRVPGVPGGVSRSDPDITDLQSKVRLVKWQYLEGSLYPSCTGMHKRSVCIYGAAELRWLINYGHWFANKLDPKVDPVLIECLEQKIWDRQLVMSMS